MFLMFQACAEQHWNSAFTPPWLACSGISAGTATMAEEKQYRIVTSKSSQKNKVIVMAKQKYH